MSEILDNPAIIAAQLAEAKINAAIKAGRSFRLGLVEN